VYQDPKPETQSSDAEKKMDLKPVKIIPSIAGIPDETLWNLHPDQFQELAIGSAETRRYKNPSGKLHWRLYPDAGYGPGGNSVAFAECQFALCSATSGI